MSENGLTDLEIKNLVQAVRQNVKPVCSNEFLGELIHNAIVVYLEEIGKRVDKNGD